MAFVGRERELAQLAEAVGRVAEGGHARVVLTGAAGIGSTRLLDELERRIVSVPGVVPCRGRAHEPTVGVPYGPLAEALAGGLARVPDELLPGVVAGAGRDLSALLPGLAERLDRLGVDRAEPSLRAPDQVARRVVESLLGTLERLAHGGVTLLILEDVHFADPATRGFIDTLLGVARWLPICLVVTYQPDELHRRHPARTLTDRLATEPEVTRLDLRPLPAPDLERLVAAGTGEVPPPGEVLGAVLEGARGNPLVALQLLAAARSLAGVRLSDPFEQLCGARLEALPREAASVVRVVATARRPLSRATLLGASTPEGRLTVAGLEAALRSRLIEAQGDDVAPAHPLYAEAIEALELPLERQALEAALARRLRDEPAVAAWHWARAARPREARAAHLAAAEVARATDPAATTLFHLERALELPDGEEVGSEERAALLAGAARASASAGSFRRAVALMRRAIESRAARGSAQARGGRDAATRLALGELHEELGRYQWAGGDLAGAISSMERALHIMPPEASPARARALAALAQHLMMDGRFRESATRARAALATAAGGRGPSSEGLAVRGHATCTLGVDAAYLGDHARGLALLEEAADMARAARRLDDLMRVSANRTFLLTLDSRRLEALDVVAEGLADAASGGLLGTYGAMLRGNAADILFELGRWAEAEAECRAALEWRPRQPEAAWFQPLLVLGLLLAESRADDEAASLVGQTLLQLEVVPAGQWTGLVLRSAVSLALWQGDVDKALAIAERGWGRALETGELALIAGAASTCMEAAAAAAEAGRGGADAGLIARARAHAELVLPAAAAAGPASTLSPSLGARQEAELHLATARVHAARVAGMARAEQWAQLANAWERRSMPFQRAKALWWQGLAILASAADDERDAARAAAREPLATAYRLARDLPAMPLLREVLDLSTRARVTPPLASVPTLSTSTPRGLVAVGPGSGPGPRDRTGSRPAWPPASRVTVPVPVGLPPDGGETPSMGADIARTIEERLLASLRRSPTDAYGLSPREAEVLVILAEGRTDRDIAARLFISERTVHVHVRRILAKLGVSSRTEATGLAIRQGLVPGEPAAIPSRPAPPDDVASRA